jgi:hypothetical protein
MVISGSVCNFTLNRFLTRLYACSLQTIVCKMILECCMQERTFLKFYGLLAERFCRISAAFQDGFDDLFAIQVCATVFWFLLSVSGAMMILDYEKNGNGKRGCRETISAFLIQKQFRARTRGLQLRVMFSAVCGLFSWRVSYHCARHRVGADVALFFLSSV